MEKMVLEEFENCSLVKFNLKRATLIDAEEVKSYLSSVIGKGNKNLLLDLSEINFMDSTFLGALVVSLKRAIMDGGDLRLIACDCKESVVWIMFHSTRMDKVFKVFDSKEAALESFRQ